MSGHCIANSKPEENFLHIRQLGPFRPIEAFDRVSDLWAISAYKGRHSQWNRPMLTRCFIFRYGAHIADERLSLKDVAIFLSTEVRV